MVGARRRLQPGSLVTCRSDWADTKPYSRAGVFVQLTFSGLVIMQHVCLLSTHCSHVAGVVTTSLICLRSFLVANARQWPTKVYRWAEELKESSGGDPAPSHVLLLGGKRSPSVGHGPELDLLPTWYPVHWLTPANLILKCLYNLTFSHCTKESQERERERAEYTARIKYRSLVILPSPYVQITT